MKLDFFKTKIGIAVSVSLALVLGSIILKITLTRENKSDLSQKVGLIADASVKKSLEDGSYEFEKALNLLSSTSIETLSKNTATTTVENLTATDRFSRELFSQYVEAKKSGQTIDENIQTQIAETVLSNNYSEPVKLVTGADLNISNNTNRTNVRLYGNSLGKILAVEPVKGDQELVILERIRETEARESDIETLNLIHKRYKKISDSLINLSVPENAAEAHAVLINGINLLSNGVEGILTLTTDPIGALTKIKYYENGINLVEAGVLKLKIYFRSQDISFSPGESGYSITQ